MHAINCGGTCAFDTMTANGVTHIETHVLGARAIPKESVTPPCGCNPTGSRRCVVPVELGVRSSACCRTPKWFVNSNPADVMSARNSVFVSTSCRSRNVAALLNAHVCASWTIRAQPDPRIERLCTQVCFAAASFPPCIRTKAGDH